MKLLMRDVTADDAKLVCTLINELTIKAKGTGFSELLGEMEQHKYIEDFPKDGVFVIAIVEEKLAERCLGVISVEPFLGNGKSSNHVGVMGAYLEYDRLAGNYKKKFFQHAFDRAIGKNFEKIITYIREDDLLAQDELQAQNFRFVGKLSRQLFIDGEYLDDLLYEKAL